MNKIEYLLTCLSEENAEVIQAISKVNRFGLEDIGPNVDVNNITLLSKEVNDVLAVIDLLNESGFPILVDQQSINEKKKKVLLYMEYSKKKGTLT